MAENDGSMRNRVASLHTASNASRYSEDYRLNVGYAYVTNIANLFDLNINENSFIIKIDHHL